MSRREPAAPVMLDTHMRVQRRRSTHMPSSKKAEPAVASAPCRGAPGKEPKRGLEQDSVDREQDGRQEELALVP